MISKDTNDLLKARYCPEGSDLRRAQLRMLEMMQYVDRICQENAITYWMDSGTLLGAVRHGGFIPWDDDVDLSIDRKDEKRFIRAVKNNPHPDFVVQDRTTDKNHWREWFTIRDTKTEYVQNGFFHNQQKYKGLQVDIFLFESNVSHFLWELSSKMYRLKLFFIENKMTAIGWLIHYFNRLAVFPLFRIFCKLFPTKHKDELHKVYGQVFDHYIPKANIYPVKRLLFEGIEFNAPAEPEAYLTEYYKKNYMSLPSEDVLKRYDHKVKILFL